jgi:hypothetical protein
MKTSLSILSALCLPLQVWGQGTFAFNNDGVNGSPIAPVYSPEASNPHEQKWGNAANANPSGPQTYTGEPLGGVAYSVEAWYSLTPVLDVYALTPNASAADRSLINFFPVGGFFERDDVFVADVAGAPGIYLQVRAWDNAGGQYSSWAGAWGAAQAGSGKAVGWSKVFWQPVAYGTFPPPGLYNFESFNIFIVLEPGTLVLTGLGGLCLLLLRRHK